MRYQRVGQAESDSLALWHWAENAQLKVTWVRVSVCASCFGRAVVFNLFFTSGGGSASEEAAGAGFLAPRVILSPKKRGVPCLRGSSSTATLGCVVLWAAGALLVQRRSQKPHSQEWLCYSI